MLIQYKPQGVCAYMISIQVEDGVVQDVQFSGGCNGNAQGIGALVRGMKVADVIQRLDGIRCGGRASSCPAQLAKALSEVSI